MIKELLKAQREICAKEYEKKFYSQMNPMSYGDIMNSILNAPEPKQVSIEPEVKPEIALSGRLEYEKLEEVMAQRSKELREYMEQFKNDKGQTIYEVLDGKQFSV